MTTKENYYAVRIGKLGKRWTYFMTDGGNRAALFTTRKEAEAASDRPLSATTKVVRVTLHDGRCT
jgi:hypothetical protein